MIHYHQAHNDNQSQPSSIWRSAKDGIKTVFALAPITFLIALIMQLMFAAGIFNTTSTSLLLQDFHVSSFHYGMIEAMVGAGACIGAAMGPFLLLHFKPGHLLFFSSAFMGVWMIFVVLLQQLPGVYTIPSLYIWVSIIGLINAFLNIPISSLFLGLTPDIYRGRAMAILQMSSNTGLLLGIVISELLSRFLGAVFVTAISGTLLVLISLLATKTKGFKALLAIDKKMKKPEKENVVVSGE